jgi:hypothetical protein
MCTRCNYEQLATIVWRAVQSTAFWREIDVFITVFEKIYASLRANDSEVPGMPAIFFRMSLGLAHSDEGVGVPNGSSFNFTQADRMLDLGASKNAGTCCTIACTHWVSCSLPTCILNLMVRQALHERNARFHRRPLRKQPEHLPPRDDNWLDNFLDKREEFHCDGAMWSAYLHTSLKPDIPVAPLRADVGRSP